MIPIDWQAKCDHRHLCVIRQIKIGRRRKSEFAMISRWTKDESASSASSPESWLPDISRQLKTCSIQSPVRELNQWSARQFTVLASRHAPPLKIQNHTWFCADSGEQVTRACITLLACQLKLQIAIASRNTWRTVPGRDG